MEPSGGSMVPDDTTNRFRDRVLSRPTKSLIRPGSTNRYRPANTFKLQALRLKEVEYAAHPKTSLSETDLSHIFFKGKQPKKLPDYPLVFLSIFVGASFTPCTFNRFFLKSRDLELRISPRKRATVRQ